MENTFSYCFLHFLTFSQHPNKYIIQFFNRLTQILLNSSKPNQKKLIKLGQIHQNPTISQSQTQCDRCRRSRSRTAKLNDALGSWREVFGSPAMGSLFFLSLSLSLRAGAISLAHTLSLSVFRKMVFEGKIKTEINLHHKHVRTEKHFRKMHFPCTTKHPHLRKSISRNHFQPIQTLP